MKFKITLLQVIINMMMFVIFIFSLRIVPCMERTGSPLTIVINTTMGLMTLLGLSVLYLVNIIDSSMDQKSSFWFRFMILSVYLGSICDNLSWVLDGVREMRLINFGMNVCAYLVMPFLLVIYWNYQNSVFIGQLKTSDRVRKIVIACAAADALFIVAGSITGFLFYLDENSRFVAGAGLNFVYVCPLIIVGCCVFENLKNEIPFKRKTPLLSFGLIPVVTIGSLIRFPDYSFLYIMFFLDLLLIYGTVQNQNHIESIKKSARIAEQNKELLEQQTQIMISQIQPHFLYNTLTAIYQLCDMDTELAQKIIQDFSVYLRTNMDGIRSKTPIPFEKELAHTQTYLRIELLRFSDILKVEYDIEAADFVIPALSLQPLVENAVKYGIRSREDGGTVTITTKRADGKIFVSVHDDGMGFDVNEKKEDGKSHIGIENTRKRLKLMMGAELIVDSQQGVGTTAMIILEDKDESVIS